MKHETKRAPMAVILAAGIGPQLQPLTYNYPKSLLSIGGSLIIERMIRNCLSCGISQFVIVLGHRSDQIKKMISKAFRGIRVTYVINERYHDTSTGYSLMLASSAIGSSEFIKFNIDLVFDANILHQLVDSKFPNLLCIDRDNVLDNERVKVITDDQMRVLEIGKSVDPKTAAGGFVGIEKIAAETVSLLFTELHQVMENSINYQEGYEAVYSQLAKKNTVFHALDITEQKWTEINTAKDFATANHMFSSTGTKMTNGRNKKY
jgi:choline kinase